MSVYRCRNRLEAFKWDGLPVDGYKIKKVSELGLFYQDIFSNEEKVLEVKSPHDEVNFYYAKIGDYVIINEFNCDIEEALVCDKDYFEHNYEMV